MELQHEVVGGVDHVRIDSPANRNALSLRLVDGLRAVVEESAADPARRALIVDHAGPVFSAGVDVKERAALPPGARNHSEALADLYVALWTYPKLLACRVAGAARGGALGIIACADAVVATREASFAFSEVRIGVAPALVGAIGMAKLGPAGLAPFLLTGDVFGAEAGAGIGLVTSVADSDGLAEIDKLIDSVVLAAPGASMVAKALVRRFAHADVTALVAEMTALSAETFEGEEARAGMAAFAARQRPPWSTGP